VKILMVCLGNICRSPIAHGIMDHICKSKNLHWNIDSAGTSGWHNGEGPDPRSTEVAQKNGIQIASQISRQILPSDFEFYDYIFAMDKSNLINIKKLAPQGQEHKIKLFLSFAEIDERDEVPDPYYSGGFDYVYGLIEKACINIIERIEHPI